MNFNAILKNLPEVKGPKAKKLGFNKKLKWTLIILAAFFILANIPLYGLADAALERFEYLQTIMGTQFGSIISLGIGPLVMSSIILQLLVGSNILDIDTSTEEGKSYFQGLQKIGALFFIVFEAIVYVLMRGLQPHAGYTGIVIFQLILGGLAILFMDEVVQKWGFSSGISLFIAAGVSWRLFTGMFQFVNQAGRNCLVNFTGDSATACSGQVLVLIQSLVNQVPGEAVAAFAILAVTAIIFLVVIWAQSLKVEIPLSFSRLRGYGMKWPLQFFYASVIPVILASALSANIQLFGGMLENWLGHATFIGSFQGGQAVSGLAYWISPFDFLGNLIRGSLRIEFIPRAITYMLYYALTASLFSVFWVKTSGMDARSQAEKIMNSGLQIPGFRKDERVLESVLSRYIMPLTIMGGIAIGLLAASADLLGALTSGTSILLAVMILYKLYEEIAKQHAMDMHPALKKMMGN